MARINIEECWWSDPRRSKLIRLMEGDTRAADGLAIEAWRLAQEFWKHDRKLIPIQQFDCLEDGGFLIQANLAEVREEGVYIRGASQYLDWVREAGKKGRIGGKTSSQRPRDKKGRLLPKESKNVQAESNPPPSEIQAESKSIQASVSGSSSVSGSKKKESIGTAIAVAPDRLPREIQKKPQPPPPNPDVGRFIGAYVKAFQGKYSTSTRPDLGGKVQGQIKRYLEDVPINRACDLIQAYLQMDEKWFQTKCHDFGTFLENQNKVAVALDTGVDSNVTDWSKVFAGAK